MYRWVMGLAVTTLFAADLPRADDIIQRSVANTMADWNTAPHYDFTERDVKGRTVKTYRVMMIDGSPYNKLMGENGEPLNSAQKAEQDRKLQQEVAKRQRETPAQRQQRVAEYDRERRQDNDLLKQMIKAMDFQVTGEATVDGRKCFVLEGTPKPGYRPVNRDTRVLTGMRGKMWIDEQQYQWVRVTAEVFRPVAFGLFIAQVEPGTEFTLEQSPVQGSLWLPSHFSMKVNARVLHFWRQDSSDKERYWDYAPAGQDGKSAVAIRR